MLFRSVPYTLAALTWGPGGCEPLHLHLRLGCARAHGKLRLTRSCIQSLLLSRGRGFLHGTGQRLPFALRPAGGFASCIFIYVWAAPGHTESFVSPDLTSNPCSCPGGIAVPPALRARPLTGATGPVPSFCRPCTSCKTLPAGSGTPPGKRKQSPPPGTLFLYWQCLTERHPSTKIQKEQPTAPSPTGAGDR